MGHGNLCLQIDCLQSVKRELQAQKKLEIRTKFTGKRYEVGMLSSEPEPNLTNNCSSAFGQLLSVKRRFRRKPNLKSLHQQSIDTNAEREFIKMLDAYKVENSFVEEWYLPQHPALCPNKPGKLRRNCNAASKYKDVCLKDKLLSGAGLLLGLIGTIFRCHEGLKTPNPDIESSFMQVEVSKQNRSCLRFLSCQETNESVETYKYNCHVFGTKRSPTCANFDIKRVGLDNGEWYPFAAKSIRNIY